MKFRFLKLKTVLAACVFSLALGQAPRALQAQAVVESKPLLVVSVASADKLLANLDTLGSIAEAKLLTDMVKGQALKNLNGLDTKRSMGFVVSTSDAGIRKIGFIPVTDFAALSKTLNAEPVEGGLARIESKVPIFVKHQNGWAFLSDSPEDLEKVPADPAALLAGQEKEYDLAVRGYMANVPQEMRDLAIEAAKSGVDFAEQKPGESEEDFAIRKQAAKGFISQFVTFLEETDRVTIGWSVDERAKKAQLDVNLVAKSGSKLARDLGQLGNAKSKFAGFILPGAAVTLNVSTKSSADQIQQARAMLKTGKDRILRSLEEDSKISDAQARKTVIEVFNQTWDVLEKTVDEGIADGAAALVTGPTSLTFVGGMHVADGGKLEAASKKLLEIGKNDPDFPGSLKLDAESHGEVRMHTIAMPIRDPDAAKVLGETMDIVIGFGPKAAYLALGKDAVATLKSAIDRSAGETDKVVPPGQLTVALGPILEFVSATSNDPNLGIVLKVLAGETGKYKGRDRLLVGIRPIENGIGYRIELEQGLIALAGKAGALLMGAGAGRGF
ncbi:MAG: hypothetical protein WD176_07905 [Pirellulales bacterium]